MSECDNNKQQQQTVLEYLVIFYLVEAYGKETENMSQVRSRNDKNVHPSTEHRYCNTLSISVGFTAAAENTVGVLNISRRGREMEYHL